VLVAGIVTAVAGVPSQALAGDPGRYADRASWPEWASITSDPHRLYPVEGELVDAIRFEIVRGYPVEPKDPLGYEDREFRFYQPMTRAEFATMLSRSLALAEDGSPAQWYQPHIAALQQRGIIPAGASSDWHVPISRREAGQWMGRAAEVFKADSDRDLRAFVDVDDPLILRALRAGIVIGTGQGRYEPDRTLIRGEAAVMLLRLARAMNSLGHAEDPEVFKQLTEIIKEADRQGTERGRRGSLQRQFVPVEAAGILTQEFADYLLWRNRDAYLNAPEFIWGWQVNVEEAYRFEAVEIHDNIAVVKVEGAVDYYRADAPDKPQERWYYDGLQFFIRRNGKWLLCAAE